MKSFLMLIVLLAAGGYFYFNGGKALIEPYIHSAPLPETIEVEPATFVGDEQGNPYAK